MRPALNVARAQTAEHAPAAAVAQHVQREHVLADPGCCHQDPLGVPFGPPCPGGIGCDLLPQRCLEHGDSEFFLAEQGQLAAVLKFEEVRQPGRPDALGAGRLQRQAVDAGEPRRVVSEHCAGQDVPPGAVRAGAVQIRHLRQHAGRRPGEQPGQHGTGSGARCAVVPPNRR